MFRKPPFESADHVYDASKIRRLRSTRPSHAHLVRRAQETIEERRRRLNFLSPSVFGEPAWDMLLTLYVNDGQQISVGKLAGESNLPTTTAIRWLSYLEREHLIVKWQGPLDRRATFVELTGEAEDMLDEYFRSLPQRNLREAG